MSKESRLRFNLWPKIRVLTVAKNYRHKKNIEFGKATTESFTASTMIM